MTKKDSKPTPKATKPEFIEDSRLDEVRGGVGGSSNENQELDDDEMRNATGG